MFGFGHAQDVRRVTENRRERIVEIQSNRARQLQRTIELLFLREIDFHRLPFGIGFRRAGRGSHGKKLEQIELRTITFDETDAGVELGDGNSLAAQLQRRRESFRSFDAIQERGRVRSILIRPQSGERSRVPLHFLAEEILSRRIRTSHAG